MTDLPPPKLPRTALAVATILVALALAFAAAAQVTNGATASPPTLGIALAKTRDAVSAALRAPCWTPCHLNEIALDHARARLSD